MGKQVQGTRYSGDGNLRTTYVKDGEMAGFRSACLSFIESVYGNEHSHFKQFTARTTSHYFSDSERAIAILSAVRSELDGGWLFEVKNLAAAELFADFLEQAEHLLAQGYKDAAAVMIGSVLEEHIRQLCLRHSIETHDLKDEKLVPRKANRLSEELARVTVYTALDAKQVTAWLGIRNSAAHGDYSAYTSEQVQNMAYGVPSFITRNPL
jgi:hypothetical protein